MAKEMPGSLLGLLDNLAAKKPEDGGSDKTAAGGGGEGQVKH